MAIDGLHHLVLKVPDLGEAEGFYRDLFDLDVLFREGDDVLFREGEKDGAYGALPEDFDWSEATETGVEPGMSSSAGTPSRWR